MFLQLAYAAGGGTLRVDYEINNQAVSPIHDRVQGIQIQPSKKRNRYTGLGLL